VCGCLISGHTSNEGKCKSVHHPSGGGESSIFPTPSALSGFLINTKQNSMPNPIPTEWIFDKYQALLESIFPIQTTKSG